MAGLVMTPLVARHWAEEGIGPPEFVPIGLAAVVIIATMIKPDRCLVLSQPAMMGLRCANGC